MILTVAYRQAGPECAVSTRWVNGEQTFVCSCGWHIRFTRNVTSNRREKRAQSKRRRIMYAHLDESPVRPNRTGDPVFE